MFSYFGICSQRSENAPFNEEEIARLVSIVKYATNHAGPPSDPTQPVYALLDPHNYARYYGGIVGDTVPVSVFADFWTRMSEVFKDDPQVFVYIFVQTFCVMCELVTKLDGRDILSGVCADFKSAVRT